MDSFEGNLRGIPGNHPGVRLHDLPRIYPDTQIEVIQMQGIPGPPTECHVLLQKNTSKNKT